MPEKHSSLANVSFPKTEGIAVWILLAAFGLFAIRTTAPHNFLDKDQERPASYILDALVNGHWICQTDWMGDVTSKPPMLTWIAAVLIKIAGGFSPVLLFVPSALAWTGLALLMFFWTRHYHRDTVALFSGLLLLLSPLGMRLFILLRTDALFAFMVALTAACAWRAWNTGKGWFWFWLMAAIASLTKGPLGLVLGASGLFAKFGDPQRSPANRRMFMEHLGGVLLYLVLVLGWFLAAYAVMGHAVADKLLRRELIAHAAHIETTDPLWVRLPKPTIYFLHRMLPWSLFAVLGMWRRGRIPSENLIARRLDGFFFYWFVGGLAIFSVSQHQRGDLLAPLLAPAMVFAAHELAYWFSRFNIRRIHVAAALLTAAALLQSYFYYHHVEAASVPVRETQCIRIFAEQFQRKSPPRTPLHFVDVPFTLQLYLRSMERCLSVEEAVALLSSDRPVRIAVSPETAQQVVQLLRKQEAPVFETDRCATSERTLFVILSNRRERETISSHGESEVTR